MDVHRALSSISSQYSNLRCSFDGSSNTPSQQNSPDMQYTTMSCQNSILKNNDFHSRSAKLSLKSLKEEEKVKFRDLSKQGRTTTGFSTGVSMK
jgi:hypothetical protein